MLRNSGPDLGGGVRGYTEGMTGADEAAADAASNAPAPQVTTAKRADTNTVDVEAKTKS
jgi:sec-independent protein translocase protein TatA